MLNQIAPIFTLWWKPRQTLLDLPAEKLYMVAYLIAALTASIRTYGRESAISGLTGMVWIDGMLAFLIGLFMFFIVSGILTWIVFLFGKRLRVIKVMNILGYANTPALAGYGLSAAYAASGMNQPGVSTAVQIAAGLLTAFSVVLWVWGLIISPGQPRVDSKT